METLESAIAALVLPKRSCEAEIKTLLQTLEESIGIRVTGVEIFRTGEIIGVKIKLDL